MKSSDSKIISRRAFLALVGAGAGGVAGFAFMDLPFGKVLMFKSDSPQWKNYVEKDVLTICQLCPGSCGLKVRTIDGFPVSVSGNLGHPVNKGGVCPKGLSAMQSYYHPSRIEQPLVKRNGKF